MFYYNFKFRNMENIEQIILLLEKIPLISLLIVAFIATILENLFPPTPSDILIVAIAAIIGTRDFNFIPLLILFVVLGSTIGFYIMFVLGNKFEHKIINNNKMKFISHAAIEKIELLFKKWGMWLVIINRFISGTRALVSFFAGATELPKIKTTILASISSLLWYGILCISGGIFGKDWKRFYEYIELYDTILIVILISIILLFSIIFIIKRKNYKKT